MVGSSGLAYCCQYGGELRTSLLLSIWWGAQDWLTAVNMVGSSGLAYCCQYGGELRTSLLLSIWWGAQDWLTAVNMVGSSGLAYCCQYGGELRSSDNATPTTFRKIGFPQKITCVS